MRWIREREDDSLIPPLQDAPFRATVLEPIGKLNSYFGQINSSIDKRNHKVGPELERRSRGL
jgi:hypothetical protein